MADVLRCHITDRRQFQSLDELLECIRANDRAGVDFIQIREKDLSTRQLCQLVQSALAVCTQARVLVNTRVDVAMACGAHGAHLPGDAPSPQIWRPVAPDSFLLGVSCHSVAEVVRAERESADYVIFAPVFDPLSKAKQREAQGLDALREACRAVRIPVLALGGITQENTPLCIEAGAAGVAGITLFQHRR